MKILVFGEKGQIASELSNVLDAATFLGRKAADFENPQLCRDIVLDSDIDLVINAAAYTDVDSAESEFEKAKLINGITPGYIAKACKEKNIPLIHISSDYVFSGAGQKPWSINDDLVPINSYGQSKLIGETEILRSKCKHIILRTSWVFSKHSSNFVKTMLNISNHQNEVKVVCDQVGGPTSAHDIALVCSKLASFLSKNASGLNYIFHYSGQPNISWAEFAKEIFALANKRIEVINIGSSDFTTKAKRPLNSKLDCDEIYRVLKIERPCWRKGLKEVVSDILK